MVSLWFGATVAMASTNCFTLHPMYRTMPVSVFTDANILSEKSGVAHRDVIRTGEIANSRKADLASSGQIWILYVVYICTENKAVGVMKPGHVFTIEPMICEGKRQQIHHSSLVFQEILWVKSDLRRWLAGRDVARWLDGSHSRRQALGPVRTHAARDGEWLRNPHASTGGQRPRSLPVPNVGWRGRISPILQWRIQQLRPMSPISQSHCGSMLGRRWLATWPCQRIWAGGGDLLTSECVTWQSHLIQLGSEKRRRPLTLLLCLHGMQSYLCECFCVCVWVRASAVWTLSSHSASVCLYGWLVAVYGCFCFFW